MSFSYRSSGIIQTVEAIKSVSDFADIASHTHGVIGDVIKKYIFPQVGPIQYGFGVVLDFAELYSSLKQKKKEWKAIGVRSLSLTINIAWIVTCFAFPPVIGFLAIGSALADAIARVLQNNNYEEKLQEYKENLVIINTQIAEGKQKLGKLIATYNNNNTAGTRGEIYAEIDELMRHLVELTRARKLEKNKIAKLRKARIVHGLKTAGATITGIGATILFFPPALPLAISLLSLGAVTYYSKEIVSGLKAIGRGLKRCFSFFASSPHDAEINRIELGLKHIDIAFAKLAVRKNELFAAIYNNPTADVDHLNNKLAKLEGVAASLRERHQYNSNKLIELKAHKHSDRVDKGAARLTLIGAIMASSFMLFPPLLGIGIGAMIVGSVISYRKKLKDKLVGFGQWIAGLFSKEVPQPAEQAESIAKQQRQAEVLAPVLQSVTSEQQRKSESGISVETVAQLAISESPKTQRAGATGLAVSANVRTAGFNSRLNFFGEKRENWCPVTAATASEAARVAATMTEYQANMRGVCA